MSSNSHIFFKAVPGKHEQAETSPEHLRKSCQKLTEAEKNGWHSDMLRTRNALMGRRRSHKPSYISLVQMTHPGWKTWLPSIAANWKAGTMSPKRAVNILNDTSNFVKWHWTEHPLVALPLNWPPPRITLFRRWKPCLRKSKRRTKRSERTWNAWNQHIMIFSYFRLFPYAFCEPSRLQTNKN